MNERDTAKRNLKLLVEYNEDDIRNMLEKYADEDN